MSRSMRLPALALAGLLSLGGLAAAQTVDAVRSAHHLACATVQNLDDWDAETVHGDLSALGGEICRAVAAAILGRDDGLTLQRFPAEAEALDALRQGKVQLVVGVSPSAATAKSYGVAFGAPAFFDAERILVSKQSGIQDLAGLANQLVCARDLSQPERTLRDELAARHIPFALMTHSEQGEMDAAIAVRRCAAGVGFESRLAQSRANFHALVADFVFLPERLSLEPIAPALRDGDPAFARIVDWTISALIEAEALGVTQADVGAAATRGDRRAEELLGHDFAAAQALGLERDWAAKVIAAVGNYGEIFQRAVGEPYRLERGPNALWTQGGLMYPLPMR